MISQELLSTVLDRPIKYIESDIKKINYNINGSITEGTIAYFNIEWKFINIYELAHLVKEWALDAFLLESDITGECRVYPIDPNHKAIMALEIEFIEDTEPDAIFAAGEWVLEQLKENK